MGAATRGHLTLSGAPLDEMGAVLSLYQKIGGQYTRKSGTLVADSKNVQHAVPYVETEEYPGFPTDLQSLYLAAAIICTGAGMSMMIAMKFVPNPADGLAQAIGKAFGKNMGFGKNILDASCVAIACVIGLLFDKRIIGIGIGTVAAMLLVGRCVAVFDHFFKDRMKSAAGLA